MKIILKENQIKFLIKEYIKPSEVNNVITAVKSICDGRRGVAFISTSYLTDEVYEEMLELISECNLNSYEVPKNEHGAYVIFEDEHEDEAKELLEIAVNLGGYLRINAPEEVTRRIGELLNYEPEEVEEFIREKKY